MSDESFVIEAGLRVRDDALALLSEAGRPRDLDLDVSLYREFVGPICRGQNIGDAISSRSPFVGALFGEEFPMCVSELVHKFVRRDMYSGAGGYVAPAGLDLVPIYRQPHGRAECFVLSGVGDLAGSRLWPAEAPRDVVEFSVSLLRTQAQRVCFLGELTCIYCDAVRLGGKAIGFGGTVLASLGNFVAVLSGAISEYREHE